MAFSTIQGSGGAPDSFVGTSGVDTILLLNESGPLFLGAQEANDVVQFTESSGTGINYTLKGGAGNDIIQDVSALGVILVNGFVNGNAGADTITAQANNGTIFGGQGNDVLTVALASSGTRVNANADNDTVNITTVVASSVFGGQGNDVVNLNGNVSSSTVQGDLGNDTINLAAFTGQTITGSAINGNAGNDSITDGAAGNSLGSFAGTTLFGGQGNDTINLAQAGVAGDASVFLSGDDGNDNLTGGGAADTINGGDGADTIVTGIGNNIANGGAGADNITGGTGNDTITGGTGNDNMTGGGGSDRFVQGQGDSTAATASTLTGAGITAADTVVFANGVDVVTDFASANDQVALNGGGLANAAILTVGSVANTTVAGNFAIRGAWNAGTNTFTTTAAGADILLGTATAGNLTIASSFGSSSVVLVGGFAGFAAANVVA